MTSRKIFGSTSSHVNPVKHVRPLKFKLWTDKSMEKAYEAVVMQGESIRNASLKYDIPKSTLHDRVIGKVALGARSGPERYLSDEEEERLVMFLVSSARIGYAKSKKQVIAIVSAIFARKQ